MWLDLSGREDRPHYRLEERRSFSSDLYCRAAAASGGVLRSMLSNSSKLYTALKCFCPGVQLTCTCMSHITLDPRP